MRRGFFNDDEHGNAFGTMGRDWDKKFNRGFKLAIVGIVGGWIVGLGVLGFAGWVVYKLLEHNGVI